MQAGKDPMKPCILALVLSVVLSTAAPAEPLTDRDKSAFAAKLTSDCIAKFRLGYDNDNKPYDPPFTEQEISNYCQCAGPSMADLMTKEEYAVIHDKHAPARLVASMMEKVKCIVVEKCKKHLNLAHPEKFQDEQCWKG
jgi:hypothetical protein